MTAIIRCITFVTEDEVRCNAPATFQVKGTPGNPWSGHHCDQHAISTARLFRHQGGCVLVSLSDPWTTAENGRRASS